MEFGWVGNLQTFLSPTMDSLHIAGRISVGVLYCFVGGAARRVGIQVNLKSNLPQFLGILNNPQPGLQEFVIG